jgi:predicted PurR-regulated permease PerM
MPSPTTGPNVEGFNRLIKLIAFGVILALLYVGRDVLIPITLAFVLSLLISPWVRALRRLGLGDTSSVVISVLIMAVLAVMAALVLGGQLVGLGSSLPQYQGTIQAKLQALNHWTSGTLGGLIDQIDHLMAPFGDGGASAAASSTQGPMPVVIEKPPLRPFQVVSHIAGSIYEPLESAGVVLMVLLFTLLEQESLRDRLIRLMGGRDVRGTTAVVNDAAQRLSRFFASQFLVNMAVGVLVGLGLWAVGVQQAMLWGMLAAVLRFIPYVGIWLAAGCATLLAAATAPGWMPAVWTVMLFGCIELVVAQLVEPNLYGHTTGMSPLSVVVAAIFWSALWGPVGLLLSTPLTLCLVVAGRHVPSLRFLEVMLGEMPALSLPERFYQRALSGDASEIIREAQRFLRRRRLAEYCDAVLMPAMQLAHADFVREVVTDSERHKLGSTVAVVLAALEGNMRCTREERRSVLEGPTLNHHFRHQRDKLLKAYQGRPDRFWVPAVLVVGGGSPLEELSAEVLARLLKAHKVDGHHVLCEDLQAPPVPNLPLENILLVCFTWFGEPGSDAVLQAAIDQVRAHLPKVQILLLRLVSPFDDAQPVRGDVSKVDMQVSSYDEALQYALSVRTVTAE